MRLIDYLNTLPRGGKKQFATEVNISAIYLSQIAGGIKTPSNKLAVRIWRRSGGLVPLESLREGDYAEASTDPEAAKEVA